MRAIFSRTGTRTTLAAAKKAKWGILISAAGVWRTEGFEFWVGDNGAWSDFMQKVPFNEKRFSRFVGWVSAQIQNGNPPRWIALPDIVMGGTKSLDLSLSWLRWLKRIPAMAHTRFMLVVQNGMETCPETLIRLRRVIGPMVGVFVGGDTEWKLRTKGFWRAFTHMLGAILHIGRVNSAKRIESCGKIEADSFDGTSISRFPKTLPELERARYGAVLAQSQIDIEDYLRRAS